MPLPAVLEHKRMELIGYHDLERRPGFKLAMQERAGRWYLYMAHFWHSGWTIVDVTDPASPQLVNFVEGPANTLTSQVQVADGKMVVSLEMPFANIYGEQAAASAVGPRCEAAARWQYRRQTRS